MAKPKVVKLIFQGYTFVGNLPLYVEENNSVNLWVRLPEKGKTTFREYRPEFEDDFFFQRCKKSRTIEQLYDNPKLKVEIILPHMELYSSTYQLLGRLKSDCDAYLNSTSKKLWGITTEGHIQEMLNLWKSLPLAYQPTWLTFTDIIKYDKAFATLNLEHNRQTTDYQ